MAGEGDGGRRTDWASRPIQQAGGLRSPAHEGFRLPALTGVRHGLCWRAVSPDDTSEPNVIPPRRAQREEPRYLEFFECFDDGRFFEAHEVLEVLWLRQRGQPDADFYKALIQIAGAFVHFGKRRYAPGAALLRTAHRHLARYPVTCHGLAVDEARALIEHWLQAFATGEGEPCLPERPRLPFQGGENPEGNSV